MNKRKYMEAILSLCTDQNKGLFNRMYPSSPTDAQLPTAIRQIEATMRGAIKTNQDYNSSVREYEELEKKYNKLMIDYETLLKENEILEQRHD